MEASPTESPHLVVKLKLLTKIAKIARRIPLLVTKIDRGDPEKFTLAA